MDFLKENAQTSATVGTDLKLAADLIRGGELVAFPTETVYGLGANALDPVAVAKIFEAKDRPHFDPLIVHVGRAADLETLVAEIPDVAKELAARFWPGPLTMVLPKTSRVPDLVTAGLGTVAVRVPDHPVAQALIREAGVPIAAPSANRFGRLSPTRAEHVLDQLGERIAYIYDGGPCRVGVESTVIDLTKSPPRLLRPGGVTLEDLKVAIGDIQYPGAAVDGTRETPAAPGMLAKHYAPRTRIVLVDSLDELPMDRQRCALLMFTPILEANGFRAVECLSPTGDLRQAAANFFAAIRRLDDSGAGLIIALPFPNEGLGLALNDRLRRAANRPEEPRTK